MAEPDKIPLVDLVAQYARYRAELDAAMRAVLERGAFIGGPFVKEFEGDFAQFCGTEHCVGVGNGTDALVLILRALGVGAGDEVIVPANTFIATAEAVSANGATPVFVDVDLADGLVDVAAVEAALTERTKVIIPVHLFGQLAKVEAIKAIAEPRGIVVLEDSAQAHGARTADGARAGSLARAAGFSFYPGKNLGAYGDGGAVTTNDATLADRIRRLANHGRSAKYGHDLIGMNSRLDGLQAAILQVKLRHLDTATSERQAAARRYDALLSERSVALEAGHIQKMTCHRMSGHVYHLYVVRVPERDAVRATLNEANIGAGVHYPLPLHLQPAYADLGYEIGQFPHSEALALDMLSLPMFPEITASQQERVIATLDSAIAVALDRKAKSAAAADAPLENTSEARAEA